MCSTRSDGTESESGGDSLTLTGGAERRIDGQDLWGCRRIWAVEGKVISICGAICENLSLEKPTWRSDMSECCQNGGGTH